MLEFIHSDLNLKMLVTELETFVQKFHQLWSAGHSAHLDLEAHAGRAWVGLRVQLGHAPGILHPQPHPQPFPKVHKQKDSPSCPRCRARRAAARQASSEGVVNEETETEKVTNEDAEKVKESEPIPVQDEKETKAEQASAVNVINPGDILVEVVE